jgi:hypothetical protein
MRGGSGVFGAVAVFLVTAVGITVVAGAVWHWIPIGLGVWVGLQAVRMIGSK